MSIGNISKILTKARERFTKFISVIHSDHAYIHQGLAYTAILSATGITASYKIGFKTPASGKCIHWRPLTGSTSAAYTAVTLYEGNSYTSGSTVTPINRNRDGFYDSVTDMQDFKAGVTATLTGLTIQKSGFGTEGNAASRSGGGDGANEEIILKRDTEYVIDVIPSAETDVIATIFWYEEDCI